MAAHFAPHLFNRVLPCGFPCIVSCERLHRHAFALSPVAAAATGSLSPLLISLKLQWTWTAVQGPEENPRGP